MSLAERAEIKSKMDVLSSKVDILKKELTDNGIDIG